MGGYWEMGKLWIASPPASIMMMAMTHAKTGRSRKKLDSINVLHSLRFRGRAIRTRDFRARLPAIQGNGLHRGSRPYVQ
jgi:hypothetical protein